MKIEEKNGREFVEYEDQRDRKVYSGVDRFVEQTDDFREDIDDSDLPKGLSKNKDKVPEEALEKVRGVQGFSKLSEDKKKGFLKERISQFGEE